MIKRTSLTGAVVMKKVEATPAPIHGENGSRDGEKRRGRKTGLNDSSQIVVQQIRMMPEAKAQLAHLRVELIDSYGRNVTEQDILRLGLDLVFERFGKPALGGAPDFLLGPAKK